MHGFDSPRYNNAPTGFLPISRGIMKTVEIIETGNGQTVPLPEEFRFETSTISIRRQGDAVILEPIKPTQWPDHFFNRIRIDDPAFVRPNQGPTPPVLPLE
jgi:virulence-associated protein VagC